MTRSLRSRRSGQLSRHKLQPMRNAWIRYRIMAWVVGTLLVVLVCVGLPLKYLGDNPTVVTWTAIPHGYLYMILLITAVDLGLRAKWSWKRLILIALAGTIPFLSFVAERSATKNIRAKLAQAEAAEPAPTPSTSS
jgi:integral membrane protein